MEHQSHVGYKRAKRQDDMVQGKKMFNSKSLFLDCKGKGLRVNGIYVRTLPYNWYLKKNDSGRSLRQNGVYLFVNFEDLGSRKKF